MFTFLSTLHFAEIMEHHYRCLLANCKDARRFNFLSEQHNYYQSLLNALLQ